MQKIYDARREVEKKKVANTTVANARKNSSEINAKIEKTFAGKKGKSVEKVVEEKKKYARVSKEKVDLGDENVNCFCERKPEDYSEVLRSADLNSTAFESFLALPKNIKSPILIEGEVILLVLRQHPIKMLLIFFLAFILIISPLFLSQLPFFFDSMSGWQIFYFWGFWYLMTGGLILQQIVVWFYNVYILTDERIIDVHFNTILSSDISIAKIDDIQDHSIKTSGFLATMLDYGTILIQTSAEKNEFAFTDIPYPEKVNRLLGELIMEEEREVLEGRIR